MDRFVISKPAKPIRKQEYKREYSDKYPFIQKKDLYHVNCTICQSTFSISHSGMFDIKTHIGNETHKTLAGEMKGQQTVVSLFSNKPGNNSLASIRSECLMVS
jgi:hypothetical protein